MSRFEEIVVKAKVDTDNSTTTPLGIDGVFTGTSVDIIDYPLVFINVFADQASATDGLSVQQSSDGTNWDHTDEYTIPANGGKNYSIQRLARYFRIVYTNGGVAQTAFRLQVVLSPNSKPSSHRIKDTIVGDDDAELVKAAITGVNGDGSWHNVMTTSDGNLAVVDNASGLSIAQGLISGTTFVHKFGNAPDFDSTDGEVTIWDGAEDGTAWENMVYNYSTTAAIDSISSSSAGDTQDIVVEGLDSNYDLQSETVTLNGQTRVALANSYIRVFRAYNDDSTDLVGHVFIYENDTLTGGVPDDAELIRAVIDPNNQQTEMAVYTIPNGKTGYMRSWYAATAGASKNANYFITLKSRNNGKVFRTKHTSALNETGTSSYQHNYVEPEIFTAKTDIEMTCSVLGTGVTAASVSAGFDIVLVDD